MPLGILVTLMQELKVGMHNWRRLDQYCNLSLGLKNIWVQRLLVLMFQSILKPQNYVIEVKKSFKVPPPYSLLVRDAPDALVKDIIAIGPSFISQQPSGRHCTFRMSPLEQRPLSSTHGMPLSSNELKMSLLSNELKMPLLSNELEMLLLSNKLGTLSLRSKHIQNAVSEYLVVLLSDSKDYSSDDSNDKDTNEEDSREDDKEEGGNDDTVKSLQQFGWGKAGQCQKEHPGFVKDVPPSQTPVTHPLTPEIQFQYSHNEDDVVAQTSLDKTLDPSDISPGPQQQASQHIKPLKNKKSRSSHDGPTPDQLSCFLEDAKIECLAQHALENPFPTLVKNLSGTITEVLIAVLVVWDTDSKQFEAGVWPEQKFNMTQLSVLKLYDDLLTWQSDLKKTAISIAPVSYSLIPLLSVPIQECAAWVEHAAAKLIKEAFFLHFGVDNQGRTQNFAHPTLCEAVITFFYTEPYQIAQRMPEIFSIELLLSCLALVAVAIILSPLPMFFVKNGHGKSYPNFSTKNYTPVYCQMLELLNHILEDAYHEPRLSAQLAAAMNLEGVVDARHNHLQILLD
ncbi:hypothetical protein BDR06DRAFT_972284 [Suillus hirtellus]|nr:hypothetical protein BDR06DRAFT_972284 [Suillus hirtellus]